MDDDFKDLETELKRLRPLRPSPELTSRIERRLGQRASWFAAWTALPVAAALMLAFVLARPTEMAAASVYKPVSSEGVLYQTRDEGLITLADGTPARQVRDSYVETITWKNPKTNASLRWTVPHEEVRVVPINYQ
jgi:hypothetical protein